MGRAILQHALLSLTSDTIVRLKLTSKLAIILGDAHMVSVFCSETMEAHQGNVGTPNSLAHDIMALGSLP